VLWRASWSPHIPYVRLSTAQSLSHLVTTLFSRTLFVTTLTSPPTRTPGEPTCKEEGSGLDHVETPPPFVMMLIAEGQLTQCARAP
jgi:hypothetical protein